MSIRLTNADEIAELKSWLIALMFIFFSLGLIVSLSLFCAYFFSINQLGLSDESITLKDILEFKTQGVKLTIESLKIVTTAFGGIAVLFNVYYAAKRTKALDESAIAANKSAEAANKNAEAALKNAQAAQDKQITERFTKAIEQLASPNLAIRLGGIYALERIAKNSSKDSDDDHWIIMEVLATFVREPSSLEEPSYKIDTTGEALRLRTDIQAALTVIGRREIEKDKGFLDLSNADIRGAALKEAKLQGVVLTGAKLQGVVLTGANLQKARLDKAKLQGAILIKTDLTEASLVQTDLRDAILLSADLRGANFINTSLQGSTLSGANLSGAKHLTEPQLKLSDTSRAILPDYFERSKEE
ncbi:MULTISPECIES: pentapeptide repeat-containing protein [Trichocoleus]|uniref:Pentapeptide repeat-containing protein n=1 Tax=Trichocoleus desertorum GB2-A4 TaxID=2933944 RepID=A0ABV0J6M8_9CYAN|nr:pentapeptide repeat-containing protein [Trichocoleus sp. FACHB-46]MBD1863549.1 pentapeptide repeat-containing protein [Trichocoleus sp. FACHB-46]